MLISLPEPRKPNTGYGFQYNPSKSEIWKTFNTKCLLYYQWNASQSSFPILIAIWWNKNESNKSIIPSEPLLVDCI